MNVGGSRRSWRMSRFTTDVMYEVPIKSVDLLFGNQRSFYPEVLSNGRGNYLIFEALVRELTGLEQGEGCDHRDKLGQRYEQKSYKDRELYPKEPDYFRVSPSSTFPANNNGPKIKELLAADDYDGALELCKTIRNGYNSIDFFILTNTGGFKVDIPMRFFVLSKDTILSHLSDTDPRQVSLQSLFSILQPKIIQFPWD
jgi:hypothetical protein